MATNYALVKPEQVHMGGRAAQVFAGTDALLVKQTMKGCFQECLGCEAKSEYKISSMDFKYLEGAKVTESGMSQPDIMHAIETSSFYMRCCWRDGRGFAINVTEGGHPEGGPLLTFTKPCGLPLYFQGLPCCCCLPEVIATSPDGADLGVKSEYLCDTNCFVPKLLYSEGGQPVYLLKPETCCGGCCIACHCSSCKGLGFLPFYFHEPTSGAVVGGEYGGPQTPQIRKVWAGFKKECCSTADTFAVFFPSGSDARRKAGILGLTFLLDFTVFERQQQDGN